MKLTLIPNSVKLSDYDYRKVKVMLEVPDGNNRFRTPLHPRV